MAFMGIMVAGVVLVVILVIVGIYLFTGFALMVTGLILTLVDRSKEKKYNEAAQSEAAVPYKKKKAPRVVLYFGVGMWVLFAVLIGFLMITASIRQREYEESCNLFYYVQNNNLERAEELIAEGAVPDSGGNTEADSNVPAEPGEETILFSLCNRDVFEEDKKVLSSIEFLLDHGADTEIRVYRHKKGDSEHQSNSSSGFNMPDGCGRTALMAAAGSGRPETVKLLIEHGADVNAVDFSGATALMRAASSMKGESSADVIRILIQNGADIKVKDNFGQNVWDYADWADSDPVRQALREAGN